jgi:hypothetical protein
MESLNGHSALHHLELQSLFLHCHSCCCCCGGGVVAFFVLGYG